MIRKENVQDYLREATHHLTQELLPFWTSRMVDRERGGYLTHFDEAGRDTGVLFAVSAVTPKTDPAKLAKTTINYAKRWEQFRGLKDWRLQWSVLTLITIMIYLWLW